MLGEPTGLLDVAHLGSRAAAAPLLGHQAELVPSQLEDLGDGPRDGRAVERRLAVDEQDRLAADRDAEAVGPVADVRLVDGRLAEDRLVNPLVGQRVPALPLGLVDAAVDGEGADGLDDVDGAGAEAVEVAGEQRVRAAQLAGPALRAVHVVGGDVLDVELAPLHRHDVGVERRRTPGLVAADLHDRAHLAAELVSGREAVVRRVAPLLEELGQAGVAPLNGRRGHGDLVRHGLPVEAVAHPGRERLRQGVTEVATRHVRHQLLTPKQRVRSVARAAPR